MSWLSEAIKTAIDKGEGLAVGKLGTCEAETMFIHKNRHPYNWPTRLQMTRNAGLWPDSNKTLQQWAVHMEKHTLPAMDGMALWWYKEHEESTVQMYAAQAHTERGLDWMNPWMDPWTLSIPSDAKVCVVSPFSESIEQQMPHLNQLFGKPIWQEPVPTIIPIKTGCSPVHDSTSPAAWNKSLQESGWKAAVDSLVNQVIDAGARVAIVGCGALSLPIVAALKKRGIIAIHTGGVTQVIFGIRGGRWLNDPDYKHLMDSPLWTNPTESEIPIHAKKIEKGCYWVLPTNKI
jgi:hypothetical protein